MSSNMLMVISTFAFLLNPLNGVTTHSQDFIMDLQSNENPVNQEFQKLITPSDIRDLAEILKIIAANLLDWRQITVKEIENLCLDFYLNTITINDSINIPLLCNDSFVAKLKSIEILEGGNSYSVSSIFLEDSYLELVLSSNQKTHSGMVIVVNCKFMNGVWEVISVIFGDS